MTCSMDPGTHPWELLLIWAAWGTLKIALSVDMLDNALCSSWPLLKLKKKISRFEKASEETGFSYKDRADIWKSSDLTVRVFMEIKRPVETQSAACEYGQDLAWFCEPCTQARVMNEGINIYHFKSKSSGWLYLEAGPGTAFVFCLIHKYLCIFYGHTIGDAK